MRTLGRLAIVAAGLLLPAATIAASPAPTATPTEYDRAYALGIEAYVYGLPMLTEDATFQTMTSVTVPQGAFGPVNRFNHERGEHTAASTAVVAPGATSLSSIAWLDLTAGPQVLHIPEITGHDWMLAFLDPWTENVVLLSNAAGTAPGHYLIAGPGQHAIPAPPGAGRIDVEATRIWIIGSTQLLGPDDLAAVHRIQDGYTLTPLDRPAAPAPDPTPEIATITRHTLPQGLAYFNELGRLLAAFPPPAADAPLLARLATVGIGPGRSLLADSTLPDATLQGLADAVADGPAVVGSDLQALVEASAPRHNGYLLGGFGHYGTDYRTRAVVSQIGLGAVIPEQAVYALAWTDRPVRIHLAAPPPTREGWSLTVYDLDGRLIPNDLGRSALSDTAPLTRNRDGSIDLLLQPTPPIDPALLPNWLPTPATDGFEVAWRFFAPDPAALPGILDGTGWQPPKLEPID